MLLLIIFDRIDRDPRGDVVRKMKLSRADTAERDAVQTVLHRCVETGEITAFEKLAVFLSEPAADDGSHCVDHIFARQVKSRCDFCLSCRFLVALRFHQFIAGVPELYPGIGVDGVVDAAVAGIEATEHLRIGGVDDGVASQCGDVALPKIDTLLHRQKISDIGNALARSFLLQILILHTHEILADRRGHTDIEQRT